MMAESGRYALNAQLDSNQIFLEAKHRWLRPAEICEILQNYKKFHIAPEPPNRPPSGCLFLFDRKVLRHFRRDGHNWRKNKNGRTMKEAHERLKSGSVDVLHCYYSYGEDNEKFQRRSYWMLEEELSHIALVHYMEVKGIPTTAVPPPAGARPPLPSPQCHRRSLLHSQGNRTNFNQISDANGVPASRQNEEDISNTKVDSSAASRVQPCDYRSASPVTDKTSLNSTQASEREEAEPDINQILLEVQHRWLHPSEICEILQNYKKFGIAPEPPNRPQSGSLFLFDRKVLRYFRKDGHNWKKKKDGKKVNEAHERLKAESIDVLHCYYAHGEDNENFQRRSYWMLKEELSHIVLVHYLEVKGNRTNFNCITDADGIPASWKNEEDISNPKVDNSAASRFQPYDYQRASPVTDTTSLNSTQASEHEASDRESLHVSKWSIDQKSGGNLNLGQNPCNPSLGQPLSYDLTTKLNDVDQVEVSDSMGLHDTYLTDQSGQPLENDLQLQALNTVESSLNLEPDGNVNVGGAMQEGLKSPDSLDRWISEELGDVTESTMQPDFVAYWGAVGSEDDCAFLLLPQKTQNAGQHDEPRQAAAIRLQSKFRSWRGRKDFLLIRQSIIKIQAHVRGHQVRKNYRKIIWSVGILEKSILRWRRKGRGLSGLSADTSMVDAETKEDDYDFLKEMQDNETKMVGNSPCASCQLLRRRCAKDCIFAPYFPSDDPHKFAIVHKVFCASNVSKMLQEIPVHQRADAVSCLVYEANARVRDPVYGCVGAISYLQNQVSQLQMLLAETQAEILCNQMQQQDLLMAAT